MTSTQTDSRHRLNRRVMRVVLATSVLLTGGKFLAWWLTSSTAILTDALESIVNVVAGAFALYSVTLAGRPRDANHPYGHGKVEYFAAGFEGGLIAVAGLLTFGEAIRGLILPPELASLQDGVWLVAAAGAGNALLATWLGTTGKQTGSLTLRAESRHLWTDVVTSVGVIIGLGLVLLTGEPVIDAVVAAGLALHLLYTGAKLLRQSVAGLMDETPALLLETAAAQLNANRHDAWIDVHHLRLQRFGTQLHLDCHLTLPYYYDLNAVRTEIRALEAVFRDAFAAELEGTIRPDPCIPSACRTCTLPNCPVRTTAFEARPAFTPQRLGANLKLSEQTSENVSGR